MYEQGASRRDRYHFNMFFRKYVESSAFSWFVFDTILIDCRNFLSQDEPQVSERQTRKSDHRVKIVGRSWSF